MLSVLVVEDNPSVYTLIKEYHHTIARNAKEAGTGLWAQCFAALKT